MKSLISWLYFDLINKIKIKKLDQNLFSYSSLVKTYFNILKVKSLISWLYFDLINKIKIKKT